MKKIAIILGTRPEIIKLSPLIEEFDRRKKSFSLIHTGQHYTQSMDKIFFDQLGLPSPDFNLKVGSGSHAEATAAMLVGIEKILAEIMPQTVIVEGDTNTVLAACLAAAKLNIPVSHVEAGLRSFDRKMPEEINRVVTDHLSTFLFAPTKMARENLVNEGISRKRIFVTGNTIVDVVRIHLKLLKQSFGPMAELLSKPFILLTLHRQENVDNPLRFRGVLKGVKLLSQESGVKVIYPMHPRSKKMCREYRITLPSEIHEIDPIDYFSFLSLESKARLILTDSGGVQEEACILQVPCVTLRDTTERPETLILGANVLSGARPEKILSAGRKQLDNRKHWSNPFGDGHAAKHIVDILAED